MLMQQQKILIVMQADIFAMGLQVQLNNWGFMAVEIVKTCEAAFRSMSQQKPALVIMDQKLFDKENNSGSHELISYLYQTPVIFMKKQLIPSGKAMEQTDENRYYWVLSNPCTETDLKLIIEDIFDISIPTS
jgi:DNA-binding NtrC family response regulator